MKLLGIDIGGSGIKGAIVDSHTGELLTERFRIPTPKPATPDAVAQTVKTIVEHFEWTDAVGVSFPCVVVNGKCMTKGNISEQWLGVQIDELFSKVCNGLQFYVANDADLAGVAEMNLGAGKDEMGKVVMITIGTGIGSGMFQDGRLVPNTELGYLRHKGDPIEWYMADSARKRDDLSLKKWAKRFDFFLTYMKRVVTPNLVIIGGGISKKFAEFEPYLTTELPIKVAKFRNNAGIIGAAIYALEKEVDLLPNHSVSQD
ncbi:MAG: polyphosphate--glucose phosphotransferase [bacterium]